MIGYHAASDEGLRSYEASGAILPPVRFWVALEDAEEFARSHGRKLILRIETGDAHMLLRKPFGQAYWTPTPVSSWQIVARPAKPAKPPALTTVGNRVSLFVTEEADDAVRVIAAETRKSISHTVDSLIKLGVRAFRAEQMREGYEHAKGES